MVFDAWLNTRISCNAYPQKINSEIRGDHQWAFRDISNQLTRSLDWVAHSEELLTETRPKNLCIEKGPASDALPFEQWRPTTRNSRPSRRARGGARRIAHVDWREK